MAEKGYNSIDEFKNKLKEWSKEGVSLSREARMNKKKANGATATATTVAKGGAGVGAENQMVTALLVVVIAVLLADKMNLISI